MDQPEALFDYDARPQATRDVPDRELVLRSRLMRRRLDGKFVNDATLLPAWQPKTPGQRLRISSLGMGVESSAIDIALMDYWTHGDLNKTVGGLEKGTLEKFKRMTDTIGQDNDPHSTIFLTSMTGSEWPVTRTLMETYLMPSMREAGVRYVQLARHGQRATEGITVLDDSIEPTRLYLEGDYTLEQEMRLHGTVPQGSYNNRLCSIRAKGTVLEHGIKLLAAGQGYEHWLGFNANEYKRATDDKSYVKPGRQSFYPLIEAGITREEASAYLTARYGVLWFKSFCYICPFPIKSNELANETIFASYQDNPLLAVSALMTEFASLCLNPKQPLLISKSLLGVFEQASGFENVLREFEATKAGTKYRIYELGRITKLGPAARSVVPLDAGSGTFAEMTEKLRELAGKSNVVIDRTTARAYFNDRTAGASGSNLDHFLVVAPNWIAPKTNPQFAHKWEQGSGGAFPGKMARAAQDSMLSARGSGIA